LTEKMKKTIFILAVTITLMAGQSFKNEENNFYPCCNYNSYGRTIFSSFQSSVQKQEAAQAKVQDAKQEVNDLTVDNKK